MTIIPNKLHHFRNVDDKASQFTTKAWLERVIVVGARKPNGVSIKENGKWPNILETLNLPLIDIAPTHKYLTKIIKWFM